VPATLQLWVPVCWSKDAGQPEACFLETKVKEAISQGTCLVAGIKEQQGGDARDDAPTGENNQAWLLIPQTGGGPPCFFVPFEAAGYMSIFFLVRRKIPPQDLSQDYTGFLICGAVESLVSGSLPVSLEPEPLSDAAEEEGEAAEELFFFDTNRSQGSSPPGESADNQSLERLHSWFFVSEPEGQSRCAGLSRSIQVLWV
jgi:hypothetical protein